MDKGCCFGRKIVCNLLIVKTNSGPNSVMFNSEMLNIKNALIGKMHLKKIDQGSLSLS